MNTTFLELNFITCYNKLYEFMVAMLSNMALRMGGFL